MTKIGKAAGIVVYTHPRTGAVKYASAHDLRRSFGERWARVPGVTPQILMELMRHESIQTTMRYYVGRNAAATADAVWAAWEQERSILGSSGPEGQEGGGPDEALSDVPDRV